jgi:hypothetical protein
MVFDYIIIIGLLREKQKIMNSHTSNDFKSYAKGLDHFAND